MRAASLFITLAGASASGWMFGCGGHGAGPAGGEAPGDSGSGGSLTDAGDAGTVADDGAGADGAAAVVDAFAAAADDSGAAPPIHSGGDAAHPGVAGVRVAHWSPDAPSVDLCLAPHGTTAFQGPLMRGLVAAERDAGLASDGGLPGVSFPEVSAYSYVSPARYDARLVVAGAGDCTVGIAPDAARLLDLTADAYATVALLGNLQPAGGDPGLTVIGLLDDSVVATGQLELRVINAAPHLLVADVGTGTVASFQQLFLSVPYGQVSSAQEEQAREMVLGVPPAPPTWLVDANGYAHMGPISSATLSVHVPYATYDVAVAPNLFVAAGAVVTMALVAPAVGALAADGGAPPPAQIVECVDNAGTIGTFGNCSVISR